MRRLPDDIARCAGVGSDVEGWREGCEDCLRRICPPGNPERVVMISPPPLIEYVDTRTNSGRVIAYCDARIEP